MKNFTNAKKECFLEKYVGLLSLEDPNSDLTIRCKFNFSYFDSSQKVGQNFNDWTHTQLCQLLDKLKEYTKKPLDYWWSQRVGAGGLKILEIYGAFPSRSCFKPPKFIPHEVQWGRFRLGSSVRLAGFIIPAELHNRPHRKTGELFDKNTFYVVFLDQNHKFYLTEKA